MNEFSWSPDFAEWTNRRFAPPAPRSVKLATIQRHYIPGSTWIETGTYLAETTLAMADLAPRVISIEPKQEFVDTARAALAQYPHVEIIQGLSEDVLPSVLSSLDASSVTFWLDGHWSAGNTFLGPKPCPLVDEMRILESPVPKFQSVCIAIDDVRCFGQVNLGFPDLPFVVDWAERLGLKWIIEHDILIMKSPSLPLIPDAL